MNKKIIYKDVDWIQWSNNKVHWRDLVSTLMNLLVICEIESLVLVLISFTWV
jgi:hypothetical protein